MTPRQSATPCLLQTLNDTIVVKWHMPQYDSVHHTRQMKCAGKNLTFKKNKQNKQKQKQKQPVGLRMTGGDREAFL